MAVFFYGNEVGHCAGDPSMIGSRLKLHHRCEPILVLQRLSHRSIAWADACADEGPVKVLPGIEEFIQVHRLVSAMKIADADVENAGSEVCAIISRFCDRMRQVCKMGELQSLAHGNSLGRERKRHWRTNSAPSITIDCNNVNMPLQGQHQCRD